MRPDLIQRPAGEAYVHRPFGGLHSRCGSCRLGLLRFDDHELVPIVVSKEEKQWNRAVPTRDVGIDIHSLASKLGVVGTWVKRLEGSAPVDDSNHSDVAREGTGSEGLSGPSEMSGVRRPRPRPAEWWGYET